MSFHDRLKKILSGKIPKISAETGIADQSMRKWEKGAFPKADSLIKICESEGVSADWLLLGKEKESAVEPLRVDQEFTLVPLYRAKLSCGDGSLQTSDQVVTNFAFRNEFVHRKGNGKNLCCFLVTGDSMSPAINDKDVVMVDLSRNDPQEIVDGKIYAFREGGSVRAKRLSLQGGRLEVISDNKIYEPYDINEGSDFLLFGRVVWSGHEFED